MTIPQRRQAILGWAAAGLNYPGDIGGEVKRRPDEEASQGKRGADGAGGSRPSRAI